MTTRFLKGCKYMHRGTLDTYIQVEAVDEYEDFYKMAIIWRKKSNDEILTKDAHIVCVLKSVLNEWNQWLK